MLQAGLRPREPRVRVLVPCRMHANGGWSDVCIHNASSRGLLLKANQAPKPGSYVDIRRGTLVIIGRVAWQKDHFFGIRTQDGLSVRALVEEPRREGKAPCVRAEMGDDRRTQSRLVVEGRIARRVEQSQRVSSILQFGFLALGAIVIAMIVAEEVGLLLSKPLAAVSTALR